MTDITTEKARIGAPSAQPFINGFTEEGESLSPVNAAESKSPLAGEAVKRHSHGGGAGVPDSSRAGRLTSYKLADFKPLTGMEEDWRFTPLKRLRGLHTEVLNGTAPSVSVTAPDSVTVETVGRNDRRIGSAAIPEDRVSGIRCGADPAVVPADGLHSDAVRGGDA
ncbi:MAG: Fe-S cluster assembly protein SufD, partial [Arthrobacter sp.]|nr:Fe-S cluster assembly protein SufD [Arthrobacter sp.]